MSLTRKEKLKEAERLYAKEHDVTVEHAQKLFWHDKKTRKAYVAMVVEEKEEEFVRPRIIGSVSL